MTRFAAALISLCAAATFSSAQEASYVAGSLPPASIYVLGELHDNPTHHLNQAAMVADIAPKALVFEMLAPIQAARVGPLMARDETLGTLLGWEESGWPDFAMYLPIFQASDAPIVGAGGDDPRDLAAFALDTPLPEAQQEAREALQMAAHCDMLPTELLPQFVARQREVDARLARATLDALTEFGPPVVLIAGNGHARKDWAVPAMIALADPTLTVVSVVQGESGDTPPGDMALVADAPLRTDPCAAFR